ncbi:SGNH/GDSL hydrolase family protein [Ottowia thiooxydans]|uniref:SGNH/GDSL hydrolase family protein n=1 Tax=Ottowia thiooxydans TaxID=219182 RepID=UPI0003F83BB5|nr:SGNH/GDSL hydrolase family protein [Ottowia thiooxydans]
MQRNLWTLPVLAACAILAACGGGGTEPAGNPAGIKTVKVMGDSLADNGTFAGIPGMSRTFTVQGSSSEPNVIWTERVAANVGASPMCAYYRFNGSGFTPTPGCTSFAIGGGRINAFTQPGGQQSPLSVVKQITDAAKAGTGFQKSDLVLIDGGGNDAADLIGAYIGAARDGGAAYAALLGSLLPQATLQALMAQPQGAEKAGGAYMTALADLLYGTIKSQALDQGAEHVAVLNMPPVTLTPRFQMVLKAIAAAQGEAASAQAGALFDVWVQTFNARLAQEVGAEKRVIVVDFYTNFVNEMKNPAQYGLTNVTTPACPPSGVGSDGLPTYSFATCTAASLSAMTPPAGSTGGTNWWTTYAFADSFHPTPYGYQLMAQMVTVDLAKAGWL